MSIFVLDGRSVMVREKRKKLSILELRCCPLRLLTELCVFCHTQDCMVNSHTLVHQASNESRASVAESISEFFDAQEVLLSASSSENEVGILNYQSKYSYWWTFGYFIVYNRKFLSKITPTNGEHELISGIMCSLLIFTKGFIRWCHVKVFFHSQMNPTLYFPSCWCHTVFLFVLHVTPSWVKTKSSSEWIALI